METIEIFNAIATREATALRMHNELADLFDFMNFHGFKRLHEYQYLKESADMRGVHRYAINHCQRIVTPDYSKANTGLVPTSLNSYSRNKISSDSKRKITRECFNNWLEWERETKSLLEEWYSNLCEMKQGAAAIKVKCLMEDSDQEVKHAERLCIKLEDVNYDIMAIEMMQDAMHEQFDEMCRDIGVSIC